MINIFSAFNREKIYSLIILILAVAVVLLLLQWHLSLKDMQIARATLKTYQHNEKVLSFTKLFINKVLKAQGEVPFEDRLQLENAVRDINSKPISNQWANFTNAKTEADAQVQVKDLLELLVKKIGY